MSNPAEYQLSDAYDPPQPYFIEEDNPKQECDLCDQWYTPDKESTFETDDMKVCSTCSEEKAEDLNAQVDYNGRESLTEDEQAFLEWWDEV